MTTRIAMWSGPRNISTAMMRSWENRADTCVVDEPFYGYYLRQTGLKHPAYEEVIASQPTHWQEVVENLSIKPIPRKSGRETVFYQKHMTHHMLPEIKLDWTVYLKQCFLIRDPLEVVQSYVKKNELRGEEDIGIKRQLELYEQISKISGHDIPVIDARDFLKNPEGMLRRLCGLFGLTFTERMLSWPAGRRPSDGAWAKHWYDAVENSTAFNAWKKQEIKLEPWAREIAEESRGAYTELWRLRIIL